MIDLRYYQEDAIKDIQQAWADGFKHILLQSATGSGKTVIFADMARRLIELKKKAIIFTNRTEILSQAGGTFKKIGLDAYYIQAGCTVINHNFNTYIAMAQTFRNRIGLKYWQDFLKDIDLIIIDEAHIQDFNYLFESGLLDSKYVIGLTATPLRSGKMRQLALDYEKIIETISIKKLIDEGFLVNADYFTFDSPNMNGVAYNPMKGDYMESQMFSQFNSPVLYAGLIKNYKKYVDYSKSLVFCVNIEHAIRTTLEFINAGYDAKFVVSGVSKPKVPDFNNKGAVSRYEERLRVYELYQKYAPIYSGKRKDIVDEYINNEFKILVNAGIFTTGFDCPNIETIILNRATMSKTLLLQMLGRGSRPAIGKSHFNVLDFGGNCQRLGYYEEKRLWSLWHEAKEGVGLPPIKNCGFDNKGKPIINEDKKGCNRLILASYSICPFCGFKYPRKRIKEVDLNIVVPEYKGKILAPKNRSFRHMEYDELYAYYSIKNHKLPWLWRQLWYRDKEKSIEKAAIDLEWSNKAKIDAIKFCKNHIN